MNTFYENVKIALDIQWNVFMGKVGNWDLHQVARLLDITSVGELLSLFDEDNKNREQEWKELFDKVGMKYMVDEETGEKEPYQELGIEFK